MRNIVKFWIIAIGSLAILVSFSMTPDVSATSPAAKSTYVGSERCKDCHPKVYKTYSKTAHTMKTQPANKKTVVMPVDGKIKTTPDGKVKFKLEWMGKKLFLTLYNLDGSVANENQGHRDNVDGSGATQYHVHRVMGGFGKAGKQRLVIIIDENGMAATPGALKTTHLISPVQYNHHHKGTGGPEGNDTAFSSYHSEHWYAGDKLIGYEGDGVPAFVQSSQFKNSWERRCVGCHATGPAVEYDKATGMFLNKSSEYNVWCEACHGPGSAHAASGDSSKIVNPDEIKNDQVALDVCARCHVRGSNVGTGNFGTDYPAKVKGNKITPMPYGKKLADWYTPGEGVKWGDFTSDDAKWKKYATETTFSRSHHQQGFDFIQSEHWEHNLKCWDCHDPHGKGKEAPQLKASNNTNELCLDCHESEGFANETEITYHTQHTYDPDGKKTSRCSKCHMPKTAKSEGYWNTHNGDIHSHTFEVVNPNLTKKMAKVNKGTVGDGKAIANGCWQGGCHEASTDYSAKLWGTWKKKGGGQVMGHEH